MTIKQKTATLCVSAATFVLALSGPVLAQDQTLTITLAGQSMIRSDFRATAPAAVPVMKSLLKGDVKFTNFEATIAEEGQSADSGGGFLAPPAALDALKEAGINLLATSTNHVYDLQRTGIVNVLHEADARNIVHAGTGDTMAKAAAPGYLKTPNGTVALIASTSGLIPPDARGTDSQAGVNELRLEAGGESNEGSKELPANSVSTPDKEDAQRILSNIRDAHAHADVVIVYQHNHIFGDHPFGALFSEGLPERQRPPAWMKKWVRQEIDAGADIIVMTGAPLLHGVEFYKGKPIFYDLGNFMYNLPPSMSSLDDPINWESAVAYLTYKGKKLQSISLQPIILNNIGEGQPDPHNPRLNNQYIDTRGLPAPAKGQQADYILGRMADLSKPFGTTFVMKDGTAEIKVKSGK